MPGKDIFLYKIQPVRPEMLSVGATDDERRGTSEPFDHLEGLTRTGPVLLAGRTLNTDTSDFASASSGPSRRRRGTCEVRTPGLRANSSSSRPSRIRSAGYPSFSWCAPGGRRIRRRGG